MLLDVFFCNAIAWISSASLLKSLTHCKYWTVRKKLLECISYRRLCCNIVSFSLYFYCWKAKYSSIFLHNQCQTVRIANQCSYVHTQCKLSRLLAAPIGFSALAAKWKSACLHFVYRPPPFRRHAWRTKKGNRNTNNCIECHAGYYCAAVHTQLLRLILFIWTLLSGV